MDLERRRGVLHGGKGLAMASGRFSTASCRRRLDSSRASRAVGMRRATGRGGLERPTSTWTRRRALG